MSQISNYVLNWIDAGAPIHDNRFSEYIRVMRIQHDLSREELAQHMQVDETHLAALENGLLSRSDISTDAYERLEQCFTLSYQSFLNLYYREKPVDLTGQERQ